MLSNAQELIATAPMLAVYPGLLIFLTVVACNLLGDRLQQRVDPAAASRRWSTKKNRRAERGG